MNIVIVGPKDHNGSLTPYIKDFYNALIIKYKGVHDVNWIGSDGVPYDVVKDSFLSIEQMQNIAKNIANEIKLKKPDLVIFHIGSLEVEQFVPLYLTGSFDKVIFCHNIEWYLEEKAPFFKDSIYHLKEFYKDYFNKWIFYTKYARNKLVNSLSLSVENTIISRWPNNLANLTEMKVRNEIRTCYPVNDKINISLVGFYSPWKNPIPFINAINKIANHSIQLSIFGPFWNDFFKDSDQLPSWVSVYDMYLNSNELLYVINNSDIGLFPCLEGDRLLQGSATLNNFTSCGVPIIAYPNEALEHDLCGVNYIYDYLNDSSIDYSTIISLSKIRNSKSRHNIFDHIEDISTIIENNKEN